MYGFYINHYERKIFYAKKIEYLFFIVGLLLLSLGINMMKTITSFGLSPYDSLFIALYQKFGISIGFWIFIINLFFTLIVLIVNKKQITIGTVLTMILISVFVDFIGSIDWIMGIIISLPKYMTIILGNLCVGIGIGIYVSSQICAAPQEAFVLTVSKNLHWSFRKTEISLAFIFLITSFLLDGPIYIGTIILSFTTGWIIQAAINFSGQFLQKINTYNKTAM
ncbi:YczE/YyaS/YitT family protein [Bacillus pseudomycoides]|uniref:YczE/YyaS/YitT family protein n=1 Tax=Bacillus pseudomycoides TaxID=64104 RepID=UPI000691F369|nr:YitT family protein [Bacillus pseudomycoides]